MSARSTFTVHDAPGPYPRHPLQLVEIRDRGREGFRHHVQLRYLADGLAWTEGVYRGDPSSWRAFGLGPRWDGRDTHWDGRRGWLHRRCPGKDEAGEGEAIVRTMLAGPVFRASKVLNE